MHRNMAYLKYNGRVGVFIYRARVYKINIKNSSEVSAAHT